MKKIFSLLCLYSGLALMLSAQSPVLGSRICLFHVYDWQESATGAITVSEGDPYYCGGWMANVTTSGGSQLQVVGGLNPYGLTQPLHVNLIANTVTLEASDEPFATITSSKTTESDGVTTKVDSVRYYYVVNEEWWLGGDMADIAGEILADGSIHIPGGYAYYIETEITTTVTGKDGRSRVDHDQTVSMSPIYRDTRLVVANGKHEFVNESDGTMHTVDVYIRQDGNTVWVTNLYGFGGPENSMELFEDGSMTFAGQTIRDIPNTMSPNGTGLWMNTTLTGGVPTPGNAGNVTTEAITWGLTTPWDNVQTWSGWRNNRLYYTNGSTFVIPAHVPDVIRGDVNNDGNVTIADVTTLINALLNGQLDASDNFNPANADANEDNAISIGDVTSLISYLLNGTW